MSKFGKGCHLHLIDGSAFIFRAYHALPPLTRKSDGLPIGAVSGFCNMLQKYVEGNAGPDAPTHVAVIFDKGPHTFRNDLYDLYEAKPDLFVAGLASGRERVALFSFARYDPCLTFSQEFWHVLSTNKRLEKKLSRDERKKIVMGRSCKLLVHEIGHLMGLDHCIHYQCCMNGSGHLEEDFAQPMFLCPICLRKLCKLTNCDVKKRYEDMGKFFDTLDMTEEKSWIGQRLDR